MKKDLQKAVTEIVAAYVTNNRLDPKELPDLIRKTNGALANIDTEIAETLPSELQKPAVPVKKSVTQDHITCLEDGKPFKSLKRHLRTDHNLTPEEYRGKWGLPKDYPMAAPAYSETRSALARKLGLGRKDTSR